MLIFEYETEVLCMFPIADLDLQMLCRFLFEMFEAVKVLLFSILLLLVDYWLRIILNLSESVTLSVFWTAFKDSFARFKSIGDFLGESFKDDF